MAVQVFPNPEGLLHSSLQTGYCNCSCTQSMGFIKSVKKSWDSILRFKKYDFCLHDVMYVTALSLKQRDLSFFLRKLNSFFVCHYKPRRRQKDGRKDSKRIDYTRDNNRNSLSENQVAGLTSSNFDFLLFLGEIWFLIM